MRINLSRAVIGCCCLIFFGLLFGWVIFPVVFNSFLKTQVWLKPGSYMRGIWSKTPFAVNFLIYVFNITNPDEVLEGGKPILKEIGPYYFDEWKEKYYQVDDDEEDTVTYNLRDTFIFREDKSSGLTGEEIFVMPNVLLQSVAIYAKRERKVVINLVSKAIDIVFENQTSLMSVNFMDLFFRGIFVDCSSHEFSVKALCSAFYNENVQNVQPYNETHFVFSLMGNKNASDGERLTAYRGVKNIHDLGKIIRINKETELSVWGDGDCNKLKGTDSTIFPPGLKKEDGIWSYIPHICRSLGAWHERESKYEGLPAQRYTMHLGDMKANESLHCFCPDNDESLCPVKGTMDLTQCVGGPFMASMPHFYNGDESLLENVEGLNPTKKEHAVFVDFEIISGIPLQAAKRLQFNLDVEPVKEVTPMKNVKKMIFPLFWIEESLALNKTYVNKLKNQLFLGLKLGASIKWICIVGGVLATIYFAVLLIKRRNNGFNIPVRAAFINEDTKIETDKESKKSGVVEKY